jgi:hypothetical protein
MAREHLRTRWLWAASAVVLAAVAAAPACASAELRLTLPVGSLPGLHAAGAPRSAAEADLARGLAGSLNALARNALEQSAAGRGTGFVLRSDAFVFRTRRTAARVLSGWRRARRAPRGSAWLLVAGAPDGRTPSPGAMAPASAWSF